MMKKLRFPILACLCCLLAQFLPVPAAAAGAAAYFSCSLDPASASAEELVRLDVKAYRTEETAAGFRLKVRYDEDRLEYVSTEAAGAVKSGTMKTNGGSGLISCVYVCNTEKGHAPVLSGTIASFVFQVAADAKAGSTALTVSADQICNYDGDPLDADRAEQKLNLKIHPSLSAKAGLTALTPSSGTLEPEFSPSVHSYMLAVGSKIDTVEFQAAAADGGTVKASRKTLNAAGKETQIALTVTSADRTRTSQYLVTVRRAAKGEEAVSVKPEKAGKKGPGTAGEAKNSEPTPKNSGGTGRAESPDSLTARPPESGPSAALPQSTAAEPENGGRESTGDRTLVLVGDRMPSFFTGMLAAALCISVGIAISLWLPIHRRP
jgi:hypothetical protein